MKKICLLFSLAFLTCGVAFGQKKAPVVAEQHEDLLTTILDSLKKRPSMNGLRLKMRNINFETNSAILKPTSKIYLDTIASVLGQLPSIVFEISGHTDDVGKADINKRLSLNRARSVRDYMVQNGSITESRISFQGYGSEKPVASNKTEAGKSLNRRVEMVFVGLDQTQKNQILFMDGHKEEVLFLYRDQTRRRISYKRSDSSPLLEVSEAEVSSISFADGTSVVYQTIKQDAPKQIFETPAAPETYSNTPIPPKPRKSFAIMAYGEGLYAIESLSKGWSDADTGVGILQGFGGGVQLSYYLTSRVSAGIQTGFSKWQVERRYVSLLPEKMLQFTANETITRIPVQASFKLYPIRNIYFNPFGGGQMTKRVTTTSELHPNGPGTVETNGFIPSAGAAIGFEKYFIGGLFLDVAAQYHYIFNKDFSQITDPLHFAGLRIGVGFKTKEVK